MRPDRIVIGECRGGEILDMLQAMNTGHEGSMTTVHANTARDALSRIEAMVGMGGVQMSEVLVRQTISRAINLVVQLTRGTDGKRRITTVSEITGMEGTVITQQDIFKFEQRGTDKDGKIIGEYRPTGLRPKIMAGLQRHRLQPGDRVRPVLPACPKA